EAAGRACAERAPSVVRLVGHGSSDAAASYGVYAFGLLPGWTALRDSISLSVYYRAAGDFASSVVIGVSQSGRTPDDVSCVARAPIAAVDAMFPIWTIASRDECLPALVAAAELARKSGATLVASGSAAEEVAGAEFRLPVPEAPLPVLSPLLSVVPGQLFAAALARAKGLDADQPVGLTKITLAQ